MNTKKILLSMIGAGIIAALATFIIDLSMRQATYLFVIASVVAYLGMGWRSK